MDISLLSLKDTLFVCVYIHIHIYNVKLIYIYKLGKILRIIELCLGFMYEYILNVWYKFQCIIQRKAADIRPKHLQSSYFLFLVLWIAWVLERFDQPTCFEECW